jgi:putative transposase
MSTGYQIKDQEGMYYLTFQVINWIDIFTRPVYRDIIIENLKYCQEPASARLQRVQPARADL